MPPLCYSVILVILYLIFPPPLLPSPSPRHHTTASPWTPICTYIIVLLNNVTDIINSSLLHCIVFSKNNLPKLHSSILTTPFERKYNSFRAVIFITTWQNDISGTILTSNFSIPEYRYSVGTHPTTYPFPIQFFLIKDFILFSFL